MRLVSCVVRLEILFTYSINFTVNLPGKDGNDVTSFLLITGNVCVCGREGIFCFLQQQLYFLLLLVFERT